LQKLTNRDTTKKTQPKNGTFGFTQNKIAILRKAKRAFIFQRPQAHPPPLKTC